MKSLFSVHHGEYLVGQEIEKRFPDAKLWVPASRDDGIDLLVTDGRGHRVVSVQVKFSRDHTPSASDPLRMERETGGWWTFSGKKGKPAVDQIEQSKADFWILVSYNAIKRAPNFIVLTPKQLANRYRALKRTGPTINSYLWVLPTGNGARACIEGRDLTVESRDLIVARKYGALLPARNWTAFLEDWQSLKRKLRIRGAGIRET